jgi:A/G-specific adenine glycosylase
MLQQYLHQTGLVQSAIELVGFRHTFSHFHLDIQPVLVELNAQNVDSNAFDSSCVMEQTSLLWYNIKHPAKVGLAAATEKILANLAASINKSNLS